MEITGTQTIAAPRQRVWDALNDPAVLKMSLPGCESVERTSPEEFKVVMAAAIGPLRARFNGVLRMSDIQAPDSCTMAFEGQGGAVGFGKGTSSVMLKAIDGATELTYSAQAQVGGKLAQVGSRLIDSVARKMADDFFKAFKAQLAPTATEVRSAPLQETAAATSPVPQPSENVAIIPAPSSERATNLNVPTASATERSSSTVMVPGW